MRLIATMGATTPRDKCLYTLQDRTYKTYFSFQAVQKHFGIPPSRIFIIGTERTFSDLGWYLRGYKHITIPETQNEAKFIFAKIQELGSEKTYFDLTQGFRHIPMMALVSSLYIKNRKNVNVNEIFYAKTAIPDNESWQKERSYDFISLMEYVDISNVSTVVETFLHSAVVPSVHIRDERLKEFIACLKDVSNSIFANDIKTASKNSYDLLKVVRSLKNDDLIEYETLFLRLEEDIENIVKLSTKKEGGRLYGFSGYCFEKNLLTQSLTLLFESMLAIAEEETRSKKLSLLGKNRDGAIVDCLSLPLPFEVRNCIKKAIRVSDYTQGDSIIFSDMYKKLLKEIAEFRNAMAHAFTGEDLTKDPKETIADLRERCLSALSLHIK